MFDLLLGIFPMIGRFLWRLVPKRTEYRGGDGGQIHIVAGTIENLGTISADGGAVHTEPPWWRRAPWRWRRSID
ncbi:MAG: hypothetical protein OXG38_09740 [Chloroflexi bacterium]|nr:hypothetical protein [Chloroflexota bacterium]